VMSPHKANPLFLPLNRMNQ
jgi:hypothetical protein